jgi:ribosomal protein S12 methylthiotransferase accessory factor
MAKAKKARAVRRSAATPFLVTGISPQDFLGRQLSDQFGPSVQFLSDTTEVGKEHRYAFAIGAHRFDDREGRRSFGLWAWSSGTPALHVRLDGPEVLVGPLALPGLAGCGYCAWARIFAAAVYGNRKELAMSDGAARAAGRLLSREIRSISKDPNKSRLLRHVLALNPVSGKSSSHRFIPLPHCPVCGGVSAHLTSEHEHEPVKLSPEDDPGVVLNALAGWVDPLTGVLPRIVVEEPNHPDHESPIVITAAPPHVIEEDGELRRLPLGWGKGLTLSGAILSAVGEAIERYAPSLPDPARIRWARPDELDAPYLDPRGCALYEEAQYDVEGFPYTRFDPGVRHPWVLGWWLEGGPVWTPAIMAFLSLTLCKEHAICQGTSNGLATGSTLADASLRAILELVERDAFMVAWLTGSHGLRIAIDDEPELQDIIAGIEALGASVELYSLQSACGTTVLCLAFGDGLEYPGLTIALGADPEPRSAARQAVLELGQTGPHLRRMMMAKIYQAPAAAKDVREMLDHASFYFPAERASAFDRIRSTAEPVNLRDLPVFKRDLATCMRELDKAGIRIALVDVTSADVATGPFRVVRAMSPDLQPISYGYGFDRVPVARIRRRGVAAGLPAIHPIW